MKARPTFGERDEARETILRGRVRGLLQALGEDPDRVSLGIRVERFTNPERRNLPWTASWSTDARSRLYELRQAGSFGWRSEHRKDPQEAVEAVWEGTLAALETQRAKTAEVLATVQAASRAWESASQWVREG